MNFIFAPATRLMHKLKLLPKFILVTLVVTLPLAVVTVLLMNELGHSISQAEQERSGMHLIRDAQTIIELAQQARGLKHVALAGNNTNPGPAEKSLQDIAQRMAALDKDVQTAGVAGISEGWGEAKKRWAELVDKQGSLKSHDNYLAYGNFIGQMMKFSIRVADHSRLSFDPQVDTNYLIAIYVKNLPEMADQLTDISGRGAAYINTGLMEANEDVLLNSTTMLAQRDLDHLPLQLDAVYSENPSVKPQLEAQLSALSGALAFLDKTRKEVLNANDQAKGDEFLQTGFKAASGMYQFGAAAENVIDRALEVRLAGFARSRMLVVAGVFLILMLATYLLVGFYRSFSEDVNELELAVERVASGDLTVRSASEGRDEIALLRNAFGQMNTGLAELVSGVRSGTDAISTASTQIASGNAELSARTEEQAHSLQQTAASMEKLATAVSQTTDNAHQANRLAQAASQVAVVGGSAVAQVVETMGAISDSSRQINDIIAVIDNIAFQTNILALNAAVEAARAGESGRGFAVVAAEVRNLAQRSAQAAKEIKGLITDSVQKVEVGGRQVSEAGKTMDQIVESVRRVSDIISEISSASTEQRGGIEQVNQAIGHMDQITQANAALVEQAAAAAESMRDQVGVLAQAVSVFRLEN